MTTIYFIRHSKSQQINNILNSDNLQLQNEKQILSIEGESLASEALNIDELKNIDILISSNYIRAIATAKYLAQYNSININIVESFGERKFGVKSYNEIPNDFYERQFNEENFKINQGESQKEVKERMFNSTKEVLKNYANKKIAIVTHSTALTFLLKNWCDINETGIYFNNEFIAPLKIDNCEIFKLEFNENNILVNINMIAKK